MRKREKKYFKALFPYYVTITKKKGLHERTPGNNFYSAIQHNELIPQNIIHHKKKKFQPRDHKKVFTKMSEKKRSKKRKEVSFLVIKYHKSLINLLFDEKLFIFILLS